MNKRAEYSRCVYRYLLCAILIFLLSFLFPYTGDDWAWGSQIGLGRLHTWFDKIRWKFNRSGTNSL